MDIDERFAEIPCQDGHISAADEEKEELPVWRNKLMENLTEEQLWETLMVFQNHIFYTFRGLAFTYRIKGNELFVNRKEKSITRASVVMAFYKVLEMDRVVSGPKKLGSFGASYLYPIFIEIGVIQRYGRTRKHVDASD